MKKITIYLSIIAIFTTCADDEKVIDNQEDIIYKNVEEVTLKRAEKAQQVFQTVPSPYETASIFEAAGATYNTSITNPIENVNKYTTSKQQALNLGVYGADLSYANIFDQTQESMFYMNCAKKMADAIGVASAFSPETIERIEENINNRDSMMTIVNDAYWICDAYLKENGLENLSALIITGGWIEGLYLGTSSLNEDNPNKKLMNRIADQKYSLTNLMDLLNSYEQNDDVKQVYSLLEELKISFDKIEEHEGETTVTEDNVATIEGGNTLTYENKTIFEIAEITQKIRNEIIQ